MLRFSAVHLVESVEHSTSDQWRIQDFPEEGVPTPKVGALTYYLVKNFPKTA